MAQNFRMTGRLPNESMIAMDEITISRGFRSKRQEQTPKNRLPPGQYVTTDFPVPSFVEDVSRFLVELGHDPLTIKTERFGPLGGQAP